MPLVLPETYPCPKCGKKADAILFLYSPERVRYSCHHKDCGHKFTVQRMDRIDSRGNFEKTFEIIEGAV
jgi:hypothetical protein